MVTQDQSATIAFLCAPSTHGGAPVERIDTHASMVCLAGNRAWKLKRAVRYDYLDFSTVARRRAMCEAEVALNRRTAPSLYRGVAAITREPDGTLAIGGSGVPIDWVIEMERFAQSDLLDRRATSQRLDVLLMPELGRAIAAFHADATRRTDFGGSAGMSWVVEGNAAGFEEFGLCVLDPIVHRRLTMRSRAAVSRHAAALDRRRREGFVRQCHGDLHLRNIVLLDGAPVLFDGVEFNDEVGCVDVLYDVAFLLMDLWARQLPHHANAVWNAYLAATGDIDDLALLPLFLSARAAVRAKTNATAAAMQAGTAAGADTAVRARQYLAMALDLLDPQPAQLVAIGGFSGSGKSTLARALAPEVGAAPGAVVLRSDEIRKEVCGVAPLQHLGADAYTPVVSARVYAAIADRASRVLAGGHSVVADAVFAREQDRAAIEQVARAAGVPFTGVWLDAPEAMLIARTAQRTRDASDADAAVVRVQLDAGAGAVNWGRVDAAPQVAAVVEQARQAIELQTATHHYVTEVGHAVQTSAVPVRRA